MVSGAEPRSFPSHVWHCRTVSKGPQTRARARPAAEDIATRLQGVASVSDQNSGRGALRLSGPRARDVLAKGLAIDLDPRVFPAGSAATSALSHMGVLVWRGEAETYDIVLFRSVAGSFWRWLSASAAEYGYEVVTTS